MIKEKEEENIILDTKLKSAELNYNYWKKIEGTSKAYEVKEHLWKFALNLKNSRYQIQLKLYQELHSVSYQCIYMYYKSSNCYEFAIFNNLEVKLTNFTCPCNVTFN